MSFFIKIVTGGILAVALTYTNFAGAQDVLSTDQFKKMSASFYGSCSKDIVKYCSSITVTPKRILFCLQAHEDKVRPDCGTAIFDTSNSVKQEFRNYIETAESCWPDIEKLCADRDLGKGRIIQCRIEQRSQLSPACSSKISFE